MQQLAGKVVAITGAASGIGKALAEGFLAAGCQLHLNDFDAETLAQFTTELRQKSTQTIAYQAFDVADRTAMQNFAKATYDQFGRVNIVINNAGVASGKVGIREVSYEEFERIMDINFWGSIYGSKAFLPYLKLAPEAALVNISSVFGLAGIPYQSTYCASKFAIRGFTEALRMEALYEYPNLTVHTVHPGGVNTNILKNALRQSESIEERNLDETFARKNLVSTPEATAATIIRGIRTKQNRIIVGHNAKKLDRLVRLFPERYIHIMKNKLEKSV
ncbi:MAG: SDR family NAD(P)-dependent oxidoreductase [Bacteroidota bacterium]